MRLRQNGNQMTIYMDWEAETVQDTQTARLFHFMLSKEISLLTSKWHDTFFTSQDRMSAFEPVQIKPGLKIIWK